MINSQLVRLIACFILFVPVVFSAPSDNCLDDLESRLYRMTRLDLNNCHLTNQDMHVVGIFLEQNPTVEILNLQSNSELSAEGIHILSTYPNNVGEIDLSNVKIGIEEAKALQAIHLGQAVFNHSMIDDETVKILANSQTIGILSLGYNQLTTEGIRYLASSTIRFIDLSGNHLDNEALSLLANSAASDLSLSDNNITPFGISILAQSKKLQAITLDNNPIGDEGLESLSKMKNLTWLSIRNTGISAKGLEALSALNISFLAASNNAIYDTGADVVAKNMIKQPNAYLLLENCNITAKGLQAIAKLKLEVLHISNNPIGDEGIEYLREKHVWQLFADHIGLTDKGFLTLAKITPKNNHRQQISIKNNTITDKGAMLYSLALNHELSYLDVRGNHLGDDGITTLKSNEKIKNLYTD